MELLLAGSVLLLAVALLARLRPSSPPEPGARPRAGAPDAEQLAPLATRRQVMKDIQSHFEGHHVDQA